jgi:hypothetical protein
MRAQDNRNSATRSRARRWLIRLAAPAAILAGAAALAAPLHSWNAGDPLQASDLNGNFQNLQDQITAAVSPNTVVTVADNQMISGAKTFSQKLTIQALSPSLQIVSPSPSLNIRRDATNEWFFTATPVGSDRLGIRAGSDDDAAERVTVTTAGNVGIGTTTPGSLVQIERDQNSLTYTDVVNINSGSSAGSIVRLITNNVAGTGNTSANLVKYKTGDLLIANTETDPAARIVLQVGSLQRFHLLSSGHVGIGTAVPNANLAVIGNIAASGTISPGVGAPDIAENIAVGDQAIGAGDIVVADATGRERAIRSARPYDNAVLGVISTRPAILMNPDPADVEVGSRRDPAQRALALAGRVPVKVTLEGGPIRPGDLMTTSSTPGHAMRASAPWRGGIIGTALESFDGKMGKTGRVVMFLALQPAPSADPKVVERLEARVSELERRLAIAASLERRLAALEVQLASRPPSAKHVATQP